MAHESFEDSIVGQKLRDHFIAVKVDREERPDVDSIYMTVCQAMTGSGGWPLTIIMTPARKPFFAATYLPRHTKRNALGLVELLETVASKWARERDSLEQFSEHVTDVLSRTVAEIPFAGTHEALAARAFSQFQQSFDAAHGGFGSAPKFPSPHNLLFLLRYHEMTGDAAALHMCEKTLTQMYRGGLFDHIGFGFSRYATDARWLAPHFEKMLYDNALLVMAYTAAYRITQDPLYKCVAQQTIDYVLRELTDDEGGFYCAQDADSDGVEGKYYLLTPREIVDVLGEDAGRAFNAHFDITPKGNFEGQSIPNLLKNAGYRQDGGMIQHRGAVYDYRKGRHALHRDDKILTAWNGLMIAALAGAYAAFDEPRCLHTAQDAAAYVEQHLTSGGKVYASGRKGQRSAYGFLDDYAFYIYGLLALYNVTFDRAYLTRAAALTRTCIADFGDEDGGFYLYGTHSEQLLLRPKETYDGALPSGNSVMAHNLFALAKITKDSELQAHAERQTAYMSGRAAEYPQGNGFFLYALTHQLHPPKEIVCVLKDADELARIAGKLDKNAFVTILDHETDGYKLLHGATACYVCEQDKCLPPFAL